MTLSRRDWMKLALAGFTGHSLSGWLGHLAAAAAPRGKRNRACILLWMNGGPSQLDTFDLKTGHKNGGPFKPIATAAPGVEISEHLPNVAKHMKDLSIVRSMTTKEGDHTRAAYYLRTGYLPLGSLQYPTLGSFVSKELGSSDSALPNFVSIASATFLSPAAYAPGYLGPAHAPLMIGNSNFGNVGDYVRQLRVQNISPPREVEEGQFEDRLALTRELQGDFSKGRTGMVAASHRAAYDRAVRLMRTDARKAFDLDDEKPALRDAYGRNLFGQGCLLARRLVERGVPFVEVTLNASAGAPAGWDTHQGNFTQVQSLCRTLDPAWATLMTDLKERGLLETTTIVWMGEFGRTPTINPQTGRDHFPNAWSAVLGGGGIKGGVVHGSTSKDGMTVKDNPVAVPDFIATVCKAVGLDPTKQNMSNVGRPIRLADAGAKPIMEVLS